MQIGRVLRAWNDKVGVMYGPRSRFANNGIMPGLTLASLKHHVALQPLFVIIGGGMVFVCAYIGRLASKTTDVNWLKHKDANVMEVYRGKQFKFFNPAGVDFSKYGHEGPKLD
jgi:hypothetical protein